MSRPRCGPPRASVGIIPICRSTRGHAIGSTPTAFREHDERTLARQRALRHDESALIQSVQEAAAELEELFEFDEPETRRRDPGEAP